MDFFFFHKYILWYSKGVEKRGGFLDGQILVVAFVCFTGFQKISDSEKKLAVNVPEVVRTGILSLLTFSWQDSLNHAPLAYSAILGSAQMLGTLVK